MVVIYYKYTGEACVLVTHVIDDFGNDVRLPKGQEIEFRSFPIIHAQDFIESGEVH
jgi:hypothetical protein